MTYEEELRDIRLRIEKLEEGLKEFKRITEEINEHMSKKESP